MPIPDFVQILAQRADKVAQSLGVNEGPRWRDNTGTAHLYIRGALQSLERIANNAPSAEEVDIAAGTVKFAKNSPQGFLGSNVAAVAAIADKILQTERSNGTLAEAVSPEDIRTVARALQNFTDDIRGSALSSQADASLKAFAGALVKANDHYQREALKWINDPVYKAGGPVGSGPAPAP